MTFPEPHYVDTNGIRMAVYEQGPKDGVPVVMCHGFPEIAYSWRHQMPALAKAGFRAIAPDMRGYGRTGGPKGKDAVPLYDIHHLTDDLAGLLDALKPRQGGLRGSRLGRHGRLADARSAIPTASLAA